MLGCFPSASLTLASAACRAGEASRNATPTRNGRPEIRLSRLQCLISPAWSTRGAPGTEGALDNASMSTGILSLCRARIPGAVAGSARPGKPVRKSTVLWKGKRVELDRGSMVKVSAHRCVVGVRVDGEDSIQTLLSARKDRTVRLGLSRCHPCPCLFPIAHRSISRRNREERQKLSAFED